MEEERKKKIAYAIDELYFNRQLGVEEENRKILRIRYEEELELLKATENQAGLMEESLVVKIEDAQGNIQYEVYGLEDRENPIALVEQDGAITFKEGYLEKLKQRFGALLYSQIRIEVRQENGEKMDVDVLEESGENEKGEKKEIIEKQYPEEEEKEKEAGEKKTEKEPKSEEEEKQQMEEDLQEQGIKGTISYVVDITDSNFYKEVPQAEKYKGIFSCAKFVCFEDGTSMVVGEEDGVYKPLENFTQSSKKVENVSFLSHDGSQLEEKQMKGLMTMQESSMAFAYKVGQYGEPEFSKMYFNKETGQYEFAVPMETKKSYPVEQEVQEFMGKKNIRELGEATKKKQEIKKTGRNIETSNMAELSSSKSKQVEGIYENIVQKAEAQGKIIGKEEEAQIKWRIAMQLDLGLTFSEQMEQELLDSLEEKTEEVGERTIYSDAEERRKNRYH